VPVIHIRRTPAATFCGQPVPEFDEQRTVRVGPGAATCQACRDAWASQVGRRGQVLERKLASDYIDCPRAGCDVRVAPHDDHYHCSHCDSPQITGPYGHHVSGFWRCPYGATMNDSPPQRSRPARHG